MLSGQRGLGPAVAPVIGVAVPIGRGLSLSGTAAGPFDRLVGDARTGTATTTQALVTFGGALRDSTSAGSARSPRSRPASHYIRIEGKSDPGDEPDAMSESATAPLFAFGAGISVWLRRWLAATAQMEAFYTQPMTDTDDQRRGGRARGRALAARPARPRGVARRAVIADRFLSVPRRC